MIGIAVRDARTLTIENRSVLLLVGLWALWRIALGAEAVVNGYDFLIAMVEAAPLTQVSLSDGILGAIVLGGGLLVFTVLWEAATKKAAMGGGDIKLLAAMGLFLGIAGGLVALAIACVVFAIANMIKNHASAAIAGKPYEAILSHSAAFAPALAVGAWCALALLVFAI